MAGIPGSSYTVLALYLLLTAAACFLIGGIVPMVALLAGLALTIRRSDIRYLQISGRFISWFYGTAAVICLIVAASHIASLSSDRLLSLTVVEHQYFVRFFGMACLLSAFGWAMTRHALMPAFMPYRRSVASHGFWGTRDSDGAEKRNNLAAELMKWGQMRKDGAISEEELQAARDRIARAA